VLLRRAETRLLVAMVMGTFRCRNRAVVVALDVMMGLFFLTVNELWIVFNETCSEGRRFQQVNEGGICWVLLQCWKRKEP
jgi:hypothetical protein